MGNFLTASSTLMCPHGGTLMPVPLTSRVQIGGQPVVLSSDSFPIGGCPFVIGVVPSPCLTVQWVVPAQRSTVVKQQPLTTDSVGLCIGAGVQGPVQIVSTQTGVIGL